MNKVIIRKTLCVMIVGAMVFSGIFGNNMLSKAAPKAKKIVMNKKKITLKVGKTFKLKVKKVRPAKASKAVIYKTSKKKVATVSKKGIIKAKKVGNAKITVCSKRNKKAKAVVKVKVIKKKGNTPAKVTSKPNENGNAQKSEAPQESKTSQSSNTPENSPTPTGSGMPQESAMPQTMSIYNGVKTVPIVMDEIYQNSKENEYAERDYKQIARAVGDLRQDIAMVTGAIDYKEIQQIFDDSAAAQRARLEAAEANKVSDLVTDSAQIESKSAIIVGTVDDSKFIQQLMAAGKLDEAKELEGVWEGYVIKKVKNPVDGVDEALVIAGSDARGAIYGIYTISEKIGVSPFYWYSDVPVEVKDKIEIDMAEPIVNDGPDVKYRGIFINDEEKSNVWAEKKFTEDGTQGPGVNYYRKVFELMLRLKSNTLWPAMHGCSVAFNKVVDADGNSVNAKEAAEYGIIMSASHCEILLRNNVGEWGDWFNKNKGRFSDVKYPSDSYKAYDFTLNKEVLLAYWKERLEANKDFESILTLGVRGPHDEAFNCENLDIYSGSTDKEKKVEMMEDVISCQRQLIAEVYGEENVQKIPQALVPYKEMNDVYNDGLNQFMLWDGSQDFNEDGIQNWKDDNSDVILMWAEDNENYLRQDLTKEEANRKGGAGIYYHISYWGPPSSYLWLNSTSLFVMSEQMHRGYNIGANDYWILNVGDIKPSEPSMEFFLKMAWDPEYWNDTTVNKYLKQQAMRDYHMDEMDAQKMADAVEEYFCINGVRKAEFYAKADWGDNPIPFSATANGDESMLWLERSKKAVAVMDELYGKLDDSCKDAFYEQFYYNMLSVNDIIENFMYYRKNLLAASQGRVGSANVYAELSKKAGQKVKDRLNDFNSRNGNKWTGFMDYDHPGRGYTLVGDGGETYGEVKDLGTGVGASCENSTVAGSGTLRFHSLIKNEEHYFDVFDKHIIAHKWVAEASDDWIQLSQTSGETRTEERVKVLVNWEKVTGEATGSISVYNADSDGKKSGDAVAVFDVAATKSKVTHGENKGYIEANGYVAIEAEHYSEMVKGSDESYWAEIQSNGQNGSTMKVLPDTAEHTTDWSNTGKLIYKVHFDKAGTYPITLNRLPVLNEGSENGIARSMNAAVGVGASTPVVLKGNRSGSWSMTLNMQETLKGNVTVQAGWNDIVVYRSDASFVFDRMVVETITGAVPQSVLGPAESPNNIADNPEIGIGTLPKELKEYKPANKIVIDDLSNLRMNCNESKTIDISAYATNGKEVTLAVKSGNESSTAARLEGTKLTIMTTDKAGTVVITVTASAPDCAKVEKSFHVTTRDPMVGGLYVEENGKVVINAADALKETNYSWTDAAAPFIWKKTSDQNGIQLTPDKGSVWTDTNNLGQTPSLSYKIKISTGGTYYLFSNMSNPNADADSYHVLVDGKYRYTHNDGIMTGSMIWKSAGKGVLLTAGEHTITVSAREDGLVINQLVLNTNKDETFTDGKFESPSRQEIASGTSPSPSISPQASETPALAKGSYLEADNLLVINAADALEQSDYASCTGASDHVHVWEASLKGIHVIPDTGINWTKTNWDGLFGIAPALQFKIKINNAGNYYLFVNMSNPNNAGDSYFVGIDGAYQYIGATGEQLGEEIWFGEKKPINLSAGEHTLTVFAREDGLFINQLLLTVDQNILLDSLQKPSERQSD